uniref:Si:dkeyp-115e12.6 n=1 Tax=Oncorhynchus mykiss TaxID=8022 RepID=A0A8K9XFS9_ONCMY
MSWAEEDWTVGLSGRALQKVKELQVQQERLNRERQQKQLQLDSTQTSLNKQTVKYEEVRGELQCVQRELQGAREEVQAGACARERLSQDLQVKQAQVCSLEGQLGSARTLTHTLEKEVKRLEAELEKLQNTNSSGDSMLFSTPCWSMTSPWDHNGGRQEERQGHRGEGDNKAPHVRQQLKFSEPGFSPTPMFPQQQAKGTPHRRLSHQSDSSTPSAVFPWEREDPKPSTRGRPAPPLPSSSDVRRGQEAGDCGMVEDFRRETDMSGCVAELQGRMRGLQGELKAECERFRQTQDALANARKDLTTREQSLQRAKDELSLAHTRISQESDRAQSLEQRGKQLQEELKCQRQNTESSRLQHQQRTRDLDKQHQRDLLELQKECQSVEKQHQLDVNKLNQEVQQARTLHNTLQAQSEKVTLQKQALERDVDILKEKVKWTEAELKESQKKEAQTQTKLTETVLEREGLNVTLEQNRRRERGLEEEVKNLTEDLAEALRRVKELEDQKTVQPSVAPMTPVPFSPAGQSFSPVSPPRHGRHAPHTPSAQTNRPAKEERAREGEERGNEERRAKYPTEREPGEGIDSEHITAFASIDSEKRQRAGGRGEERKRENERKDEAESVVDGCIPGKEASTKDKNTLDTPSSLSPTDQSPHLTSSAGSDTDYESETLSSHSKARAQTTRAEGDLQRENRELRSELQDVKDELQRRLEDLETQRRAEAEARTRLKQLSRKHASQTKTSRETEEEEERAEMGRLKEALAVLEIQVRTDAEDRERVEERKGRERDDRESESMLLNLQLKKQLAELKTELLIEQEEREREKEEERKKLKNKGIEGTIELTVKLEELQAELEELKNRGGLERKNMVDKNTPLTYLTMHRDIPSNSNKLLPSPDQHHLLCESTTVVPQATTADLIREEGTLNKAPELSRPIGEGEAIVEAQRGMSASELGETTVEAEKGISSSDQGETNKDTLRGVSPSDMEKTPLALQSAGFSASELAQEVERLRGESAREAGRAIHSQAKLEALQSQVTRQTQQLTLAFDHQSRHIQDLLAELQEKEGGLLRQGKELQRCRDELATLRQGMEKDRERREEERQEEEIKSTRVTITCQQADHYTDIHQITHSTQNESASGIEETTDITINPLNTTQASSTLCDEGGQLTTPQKNCVTEWHDVTDSSTTLGGHPAEHNTEKMVDSTSAQPGRSEETRNKEKFKSDSLTVVCSKGQMEPSESSEMKHIRSEEQHSTKELQLSQRDPSLTRTENTCLTAELEKASGPINRPEDTRGQERQDSGGESLAVELQSLKQKNELLKLTLPDVANTDQETSSVGNTTLPATCEEPAERRAKRRKRKKQRGGQEVNSTSGELKQISDIITSGREATLHGGKPVDEERGGVESERVKEMGRGGVELDGGRETEAGDEGRGEVELDGGRKMEAGDEGRGAVESEGVKEMEAGDEGRGAVESEGVKEMEAGDEGRGAVESEGVKEMEAGDEGRGAVESEGVKEMEAGDEGRGAVESEGVKEMEAGDEGRGAVESEGVNEMEAGDEGRGAVESEGVKEMEAGDEGRGAVESEGVKEMEAGDETLLDTTPLAPLQITCLEKQVVMLQAELQSLSEENQRQAEELTVWRLTAQPLCLDPEDLTSATLSPGHNTATLSPGHNTATLSPGHNTATLSPGHNTATLSPGHNTATLSPGHNTATLSPGHNTATLSPGHNTATLSPGHNTATLSHGHNTATLSPGHNTATLSPGHNTATLSPGHNTATLSPGHNTATLSPGHNTATLSPGHNTATLSPGQRSSVMVIREDELLLSCTSSRLYGRTLASRLHHCNSPEAKSLQNPSRKNKSTHPQEMEKQTNEHGEDGEEADITKDVYQISELQTKATEHTNQDDSENKTNPNTPRATDETQAKEIVSRHNLDVIELDNKEFPTLSLAEAQSTEAQSSEINHSSHHQEVPISTGVENKSHSSVRRKVTTTSEWRTERTMVETKVLSSKVIPAGWTGQERLSSVEVSSTSSQTEGRETGALPETHHVYTQTEKEEEEENDEEPTESPPVSPVQMSEAEGDRLLFSGSFPIPADPARLAERIRRNRTQMSAAYDDTEYEPYGLPEVVMKACQIINHSNQTNSPSDLRDTETDNRYELNLWDGIKLCLIEMHSRFC